MKITRAFCFIGLCTWLLTSLLVTSINHATRQTTPTPQTNRAHHLDNVKKPKASPDQVMLLVHAVPEVDLNAYADQVWTRPFIYPDGTQVVIAQTSAAAVPKLRQLPGVTAVLPTQTGTPPTVPDAPTPDLPALRQRLDAMGTLPTNYRAIPPAPQIPDDWYDIGDVHHAAAAWNAGYTGQGVQVLVNDSGIDFCHPDLVGTWAIVTDPDSPYNGWPLMFDSYSMYLYALDTHFGQQNIAAGLGDYADTSATCTLGNCTYQPIDATMPHTYTLPATSISGVYHIGSHPDKQLGVLFGERATVLVVDEQETAVYDTVYIDLDHDYDFNDETPATRDMPIACLDNWDAVNQMPGSDGYNDLSGGLIYFISNGSTPIPASSWLWGDLIPGNGDMVAFTLVDAQETTHGQYVASNIAAQGVINGPNQNSAGDNELPPWKPAYTGPGTGMVQGLSRQAHLVNNGNTYDTPFVEDGFLFAALGYDGLPNTTDDSQIINNSWAEFLLHNDGWDWQSRLLESIARLNPHLTLIFGTSNGGPGYGTLAAPAPPSALQVGASTLFGSTATFDSITNTAQIVWGDVIAFSSRGPDARGTNGVDVTANGAIGTGDAPLNSVLNGWSAWGGWQGVSRSAPATAGMLALVYDAYRQVHGIWPTADTAQAILLAGAVDQNYDPFTQGAGMADAFASASIAGGDNGFYVQPPSWTFGRADDTDYPAFTNILFAAETAVHTFTVTNTGPAPLTLSFSSDQLQQTAVFTLPFTTSDQSQEDNDILDPRSRHLPDYLIDITNLIPPNTDLMEVNLVFPFAQLDPDGNYVDNQRWSLQVLNWIDVNNDTNLWTDGNGNGVVNQGEIDAGEYGRFGYDDNIGTALQVRVSQPAQRMADGVFLDLRHTKKTATIPTSTMQIELVFYDHAPWSWLELPTQPLIVPAGTTAVFTTALHVPETAVPGLYNGMMVVSSSDQRSQIPVVANVAAHLSNTPLLLAGTMADSTPYDNGRMHGAIDWGWHADAGDWRFFFLEAAPPSPAAALVLHTQWPDTAPYRTDIDTRIYGPMPDGYTAVDSAYYGPYTLAWLGGSLDTYLSGGKWEFQTSTNGPSEWAAASLHDGIHLIINQNVLYQGDRFSLPFTQTVGTAVLTPAPLVIQTCSLSGTVPVTLSTNLDLPDWQSHAYGLSMTEVYTRQQLYQDVYGDPESASYTQTRTLSNTASLRVSINGTPGDDLDLYLLYDADANDQFDWDTEIVAVANSIFAQETAVLSLPQAGDYLIAVHGQRVATGMTLFDLTLDAIQGTDLQFSGIPTDTIPAGETGLNLHWQKTAGAGEIWHGQLLFGPSSTPGALAAAVYALPCDATDLLATAVFTHTAAAAAGTPIHFTNLSTGHDLHFTWQFGDGTTPDTTANPTHTFAIPGTYTITLTANNAFSDDTAVSTLTIAIPPQASFMHNGPLHLGETAVFISSASGTDLTYAWDFGDSIGTSTAVHPSYTYATSGTYTVTLTVTNLLGSAVATRTIEIRPFQLYLPLLRK